MTKERTRVFYILAVGLLFASSGASGQQSPPPMVAPSPSTLVELHTVIKIIGAVITGVATLIGLPIVALTYRKTRAEIAKLELESNALRANQRVQSAAERDDAENISAANPAESTAIKAVEDPRLLAPLLIILDYIFATVVLTFVGQLLSIIEFVGPLVMVVLAAFLLLPIARQVLRVRAVLRPALTAEDVRASERQVRVVAYTVYAMFVISPSVLGIAILFSFESTLEQFMGWGFLGLSVLLLAVLPSAKRRLDRLLADIHKQTP